MLMAPDCVTPEWRPLSHIASAGETVEKPAPTSTVVGSPSKFGPEVGSRLSSFTLKVREQRLTVGSLDEPGGRTMAGDGVKTISFVALPPAGTLLVQVTAAHWALVLVLVIVASPS